jgi:hypothetical protein
MRKSILVGMGTTLAMSLFVVTATTTGPSNILPADAERGGQPNVHSEEKTSKTWGTEDGSTSFRSCEKPNDECKGVQVNKEARDICNDFSDTKCKVVHD